MSSKRIVELDLARAIAVIGVVVIHGSAYALRESVNGGTAYNISIILNQLSRFSVPLFVLMSGVGLSLSYKKEKGYIYFLIHRLGKILPLYIIWSVVYLTLVNKDFNYSLWINKIIKGDRVFYHLYYMPMIIKLYLVFPLLYSFMKRRAGLFISFLITAGVTFSAHYYNVPNLQLDFFQKRNTIFWFFYFVLGVFISSNITSIIDKIRSHKKMVAFISFISSVGIILECHISLNTDKSLDYATTFIRPSIIVYSVVFSAFLVILKIKSKFLLKFLKNISNNSYVIYLSHPLVLYYYIKLLKDMNISIGNVYFIITSIILCTFIPAIFGTIVRKLKLVIKKSF
ncbi:acyltransferase [Clostridium rectalis]|uniref:acyltransferase n=1 Tax=Clostridium rectalis TaxID=2040295 RepID=UPI000F6450ED|nr:acyltransferase [Clostridium rectalis]